MRLRYLRLPRCGPLVDVEIVFGQEEMLFGPGEPGKRKGAINFIVGVNGTGKSSLLRALYQIFRALRARELPPFPVTLAWDWGEGQEAATAVFSYSGSLKEHTFFSIFLEHLPNEAADYWRSMVEKMADDSGQSKPFPPLPRHTDPVRGEEAIKASILQAHLPRKVVAYTSGAETLWENLEQSDYRASQEQENPAESERPQGWTLEREWEEDLPNRITKAIRTGQSHQATA